ncbi:hypothetical protein BFP70_03635 [Thioclava sp. SK-1]|uniref:DUF6455 family protein n=1 Tax=Thioclava sp. SK-1 TaxID=1889770 RepID=UPI0008245772|nr:DUF6455 family protein [Thioclava sp. SK-1]OCX66927.1 hypothetical protein BFP70_03635 [Thioclava sp. SK-1]
MTHPFANARSRNYHAALVSKMARVLGVDLTQARETRTLPDDQWRDAVLRCTQCAQPADCQTWLSDHDEPSSDPAHTPHAPGYCENRQFLKRLAQTQHDSDMSNL